MKESIQLFIDANLHSTKRNNQSYPISCHLDYNMTY